MQPELFNSYKEIAELAEQVINLYKSHSIRINENSDLGQMLVCCSNIFDTIANMQESEKLEVCRAQRVLHAIMSCSSEADIGEHLKRIAGNRLDSSVSEPSQGKDALFELEFLQYLRHRGLKARPEEPDIVVSMPFGPYLIACKTVNSLNNLKGQLRRGYRQVEKLGHGCVALNLESRVCLKEPIRSQNANEVRHIMDKQLRDIYSEFKASFSEKLREDRLDGIVLSITRITKIEESRGDLNLFTHTVYFSRFDQQSQPACNRFRFFRNAMQGPLGSF